MYGKFENGEFVPAPRMIVDGDKSIISPSGETLMEYGYLPVIESDPPEHDANTGISYHHEQFGDEIRMVWSAFPLEYSDPRLDALQQEIEELKQMLADRGDQNGKN